MKTRLYSVIILFGFVTLFALPNSFAQEALNQPSVRLIYFLPNDRPPRPDRVSALRQLIKDAQEFYADEMERHGYGRKTFTIETDEDGESLVHHVDGKFTEYYYSEPLIDFKIWEEVFAHFDDFQHVYFIAIDMSSELIDGGLGGPMFFPSNIDQPVFSFGSVSVRHRDITEGEELLGGSAIIPASGPGFERLGLTAHELGHAFGLEHDFREGIFNNSYVMNYGNQDQLSICSAEWLSVNPFFNSNPIIHNARAEIRLISLPVYNSDGIKLRFEVTDADGLHQAQLLVPEIYEGTSWGPYRLFDCKQLNGETRTTVEFISEALTIEPVDRIALQMIDVKGRITWATFLVDIASELPPPEIVSIPDPNLAAAIRTELKLATDDDLTDRAMQTLRWLNLDDQGITNIAGLEHATQLQRLFLGKNQIDNYAPLAQLPKLTTLYLWTNGISDLNVLPVLPQLELLDLNWNQISDISRLAGFTELTTLFIAGNKVSDISPLRGLTNLHSLNLAFNKVSDVRPITGLTKLEKLHLHGNPIKDQEPLLAMLRRNPEIKIYLKEGGDPLPVTLSRFRAELTDAGVVLKWITESELDNAGFYILRSETKDGEFKVVNPQLIQGAGTTSERHTYTWTDTTATPNVVYYYQIEDISNAGVRKQLATVRMRGYVSASGKLTTRWANLKLQE